MKARRLVLCLFLSLALVVTFIPIMSYAADDDEDRHQRSKNQSAELKECQYAEQQYGNKQYQDSKIHLLKIPPFGLNSCCRTIAARDPTLILRALTI